MATNLIQLYTAIHDGNLTKVQDELDKWDRESANKRLLMISEAYHFKTFFDPDFFDGWRVMLGQNLSWIMNKTRNITGLAALLKRHANPMYGLKGNQHHVDSLKQHFHLAKTVNDATFAAWKHFLLAGMNGGTKEAEGVRDYLFEMETRGRIEEEMRETLVTRKLSPIEVLRTIKDVVDDHEDRLLSLETTQTDVQQLTMKLAHKTYENEHGLLRLKQDVFIDRQNRLKRAQTFIEGEQNSNVRSLIYQFANGHCLRCHRQMIFEAGHPDSVEIDEVYPRGKGGNRDWLNIQALCKQCNWEKHIAATKGTLVHISWDYRTPTFYAACSRQAKEQQRRQAKRDQKHDLPLFSGRCIPGND